MSECQRDTLAVRPFKRSGSVQMLSAHVTLFPSSLETMNSLSTSKANSYRRPSEQPRETASRATALIVRAVGS